MQVTSDGRVVWSVKTVIETSCRINLQYFPWDKQTCNISVGTWKYSVNEISADTAEVFYDEDLGTNTWDVENITHHVIYETFSGKTYSRIVFEVKLTRKTLFYMVNLLAPSCMLAALSNLAYLLPIDSGERLSLPVTLYLSETVFLTSMTSYIPQTSETVPKMSK